MNTNTIVNKLKNECSADYFLNEVILIKMPFRRIRLDVSVHKVPEMSIKQMYAVMLMAINRGINTEELLATFLGVKADDFVISELFTLKGLGYADSLANVWSVTEQGLVYINDPSILVDLVEEEFEFLLDLVTNELLPSARLFSDKNNTNKVKSNYNYSNRSTTILEGRSGELKEIYAQSNTEGNCLVDFDKTKIKFDREEYNEYFVVEYKPIAEKQDSLDPYFEIRINDNRFSIDTRLQYALSNAHSYFVDLFSDADRASFSNFTKEKEEDVEVIESFEKEKGAVMLEVVNSPKNPKQLSIWETKKEFIEAIKTCKSKLLVESPWVKRATLEYIPELRVAAERNVEIHILYGIDNADEHYDKALEGLRALDNDFTNFHLISLPEHFRNIPNCKMTGTHRKLLIKDNEYFIQGSFNFLSFHKKEGQRIANEECYLFPNNVENKWNMIWDEYMLD